MTIDLGEKQTADRLKLLCVLAHPDDETLGCGGLMAWSVAQSRYTSTSCATRGERGRAREEAANPGLTALGKIRNQLSDEQHQFLWGRPTLYRVYSFVNGGRSVEHDLFTGLR